MEKGNENSNENENVKSPFYVPERFSNTHNSATVMFLAHIACSKNWTRFLCDSIDELDQKKDVTYVQKLHRIIELIEQEMLHVNEPQVDGLNSELYQDLLLDAIYAVDIYSAAELLLKEYYGLTILID